MLRGLIGTVLLICASLLIAGLIAEGGVRLFLGEQVKFPRHVVGAPFGVRINEPLARYRHKSPDVEIWFRINSQGFRADEDYAYEKPAGVKRIIALGDSFTIGYEVSEPETFSSVLEARLRAAGHNVQVLNTGVSGYSTAEASVYLERELLRYDPDIILVAFFGNDLNDNVRSGLFALDADGGLVEARHEYVPAGRVGDFLNTNWFFNLLSERSDAFALIKERATLVAKQWMRDENLREAAIAVTETDEMAYPERLGGAIFERIYMTSRKLELPLIILSIPREQLNSSGLVDQFPLGAFDTAREGIWFVPAKRFLDSRVGRELLYYKRSADHWTPLAHRLVGEELAQVVLDSDLLGEATATTRGTGNGHGAAATDPPPN